MTIKTSKKDCGAVCWSIPTGGEWDLQQGELGINDCK